MANKIIFGADLIDVLENKYNMNQLANVPTKYKNGVTTIDFIYGKEKNIDNLKYNKPYIEFSIDDETDGFISGTMYPNGGVEGIQFDSWEDLKYFMKNAKWTESKKFARKSLKEGIDVKIVYWDDTPTDYLDDVTRNDIVDLENDANVYKIIDVTNGKKKTIYLAESKKGKKNFLKEKKFNPNDYFYELIELNGKKYKDWTVFEWKDIEDDFFKAYATWGKTFFNMYSGNNDSNILVNDGKLMTVLDKNGVPIIGKELNEIAYELNELIRNYKKTESNKSTKKSLKESVDGYIATDEDCNMSGKGWVLDGSYNFIMDFLQEWGIAPEDVKVKNGMTTLFNADGNPFGYVYQDEEVDIFVADKTTNWTWENHNPSTKRVKVTALDKIF